MRSIFAAVFAALLILSQPTASRAQSVTTEWLTSSDYQAYFDTQIRGSRLIPVHVEAAEFHGLIYYFASFDPQPSGIGWATHHGLSDASFNQRNLEYQAQGYYLRHQQRFVSSGGRVSNQGIWYR